MGNRTAPLLPSTEALLRRFGERLRLARLRRRLTAKQVAERAGMAPLTLRSVERGGAGVTMGAYLAVLQTLGVERDLERLLEEDPFGRHLQDARLPTRARSGDQGALAPAPARKAVSKRTKAAENAAWKRGFADAETLAALLAPVPAPRKKRSR